jgi:RNA polymerase sigma-70 factor (ECF subfamily)
MRLPRTGNVAQNSTMTSSLLDEFERERPHLTAIAYRMLGSRAEAEDVVQEAWLRYDKARVGGEIHDVRGWLTTVTGRISLDVLKSARVRREAYPGQWLPEPVVRSLEPDPADRAELSEEVGLALLVVLEKLTPEQRVAVVLHDAFAVPFEEVATVLNTTVAAARQHASRGRRAIASGEARHNADRAEQQRVLAAFLAAAASGDMQALAAVLAPDVVSVGDGGGVFPAGTRPVLGLAKVARLYLGIFRGRQVDMHDVTIDPVLVNGDVGALVRGFYNDGRKLVSVMSITVADGRITAIYNQLNPAKLSSLDDVG